MASVTSSQYLKACLVELIEKARIMDQQFGGNREQQVLEDFKSEISRFLGGKIPSRKQVQKTNELLSFSISEIPRTKEKKTNYKKKNHLKRD